MTVSPLRVRTARDTPLCLYNSVYVRKIKSLLEEANICSKAGIIKAKSQALKLGSVSAKLHEYKVTVFDTESLAYFGSNRNI